MRHGRLAVRFALLALAAWPTIAVAQSRRVAGMPLLAGSVSRRAPAQASDTLPLARIDARIQNRVQSRMRTRIDTNYDPQANALSPFVVASAQARTTGMPHR